MQTHKAVDPVSVALLRSTARLLKMCCVMSALPMYLWAAYGRSALEAPLLINSLRERDQSLCAARRPPAQGRGVGKDSEQSLRCNVHGVPPALLDHLQHLGPSRRLEQRHDCFRLSILTRHVPSSPTSQSPVLHGCVCARVNAVKSSNSSPHTEDTPNERKIDTGITKVEMVVDCVAGCVLAWECMGSK